MAIGVGLIIFRPDWFIGKAITGLTILAIILTTILSLRVDIYRMSLVQGLLIFAFMGSGFGVFLKGYVGKYEKVPEYKANFYKYKK